MNLQMGKAPRQKQKRPSTRHSHSIRFSDSEWLLVEQAASRHGIPTREFVRSGALAATEGHNSTPSETNFTCEHVALIEATYRAAYLLATITGEKLIEAERREDLDGIIAEAQEAMEKTMSKTSCG